MSTSMEAALGSPGALRPKLDGAAPLLKVVVREVAVEAGKHLTRQGEVPHTAHLLLEGLACRYRLLADGRRQTTALLIAGDVCDLSAVMRGRSDYYVEALTASVVGEIPADQIRHADRTDPAARGAFLRQLLRDEAIIREWMVGLGRRVAKERIAHLFCELRERLRKVGLYNGDRYDFHMTQPELADVLGLSTVHVNRVLKQFREKGLAEVTKTALHIVDHDALARLAGFDPAYLDTA